MKKYIKSLILILIILPCIAFMTACGTKTYTVSFDSDGGSAVNAIENIEGGSKIDKPEDPTKNGYNFNGWFLKGEEWDFKNNTISSDISLKASWTPIVYSITYNLNGSTNHQLNPSEFTIESETISLKAPTLTGYAFVGWYDNEDFNGDAITTIETGTVGDIELYAKFVYDDIENGIRLLSSYEDVKYYLSNSNLSQNFKLANDIDFYGKEWTAYGSETAQYNGVFDGNGHSIKNIKILENAQFVGFFGYVGINGTIKNLEIKNAEINLTSTGSSSVGIISGFCSGNLIKCSASGSITLNQTGCTYCGGLAGVAVNILECSSAVNINVYTKPISINDETYGSASLITGNIGGLVGSTFTIQDSYSSSSINIEQVENKSLATTVESYIVGGLAGEGAHTTENSYSTTNISLNLTKSIAPEVFVSSLVGRIMFDGIEGVNLSNCYATGNILIQATNSNNIHTGQLLNSITTINSTQIENSYLLNTQTIKINNYEISRSNCADNAFVVCADLNAIKSNVVSKWDNNVWNTTSNIPSLKKEIGECFIYFETNGGSHVEKIPVAYEGTAQAPTPPTKEGYIFENWYYEDAVWYFGLSVRKTITLEARYTPRTYTISFQDSEGNQVCEDKYFTFNNPYTLPEYITYQGHYFNLNEDIFNSYYWTYNGNALNDENWTIAENTILVLASTPKKYQVLYFLDGGENNQSNPTTYTYIDYFYELQPATKSGYTFIGWYSHQNLQEVYKVANLSEVVDPELPQIVSLYARFAVAQYSIMYETYGATNSINNPTSYNINTETIYLHSISKDGYSFAGWYDSENFTTTANKITVIPKGTAGNIKLYAYWQVLNYAIVYNLNGGINDAENPLFYTVEDFIFLKDAEKPYHDFIGWYQTPDFNDYAMSYIPVGTTEPLVLYARFRLTTYTIQYVNADTAEGLQTEYNYQSSTFTFPTISKSGYNFLGWVDEQGHPITKIQKGSYGNRVITATWQIINYSITYQTNGGTLPNNASITFNAENIVTFATPTKRGYDFLGWKLQEKTNFIYSTNGLFRNITLVAYWDYTVYTIDYSLDDGTPISSLKYTYTLCDSYTLPELTKDGYTFEGWFDDDNFETANKVTGFEVGTIGNKYFFAKFTIINYTITYVTYDKNVNNSANPVSYTVVDNNITLQNITRTGYTFAGWYDGENFETANKVTTISTQTKANITLYAKWQIINYSITYIANVETELYTKTYTVEDSIVLTIPELTGKTVAGWIDTTDGNKIITTIPKGTTGDKILELSWEYIIYTITYVTNGGTFSVQEITTFNVDDSIELSVLEKTHYNFNGWFAENTFENEITEIEKGTIGNKTFYAKWTAIAYTISYQPNNGTLSGFEATSYTIENHVTFEIPTRTGYEFKGWFTTSNFEANTKVESTSDLLPTLGNIEIYAKWEIITYMISYTTYDDSIDNSANKTSFTVETETFNIEDVSRIGYTFLGWFDSENFETSNKVECIEKGTAENITLYAKWQITIYSITYNTNEGALSGSQKASYTIEDEFDFEIPTRTGCEFKGWFTTSTFENGTDLNSISEGSYGNIEIYAKWEMIDYTISYITYDENVDNSANKKSFTIETETFNIEDVSRIGCTFLGWFDSENLETANKVEYIEKGTAENITLYAKWQLIHYSITYNTNEGTLSGSQKTYYTIEDEFDFEIPTRDNYEFKGWFTTSTFENGTDLNSISEGSYGNIEIFAKWEIITYSITYNINGGTLSGSQKTYYTIEDEFDFEEPYKHGYLFIGWYDNENFETANKVEKITAGTTGNITLYAKYSDTHDHEGYYKISTPETLISYSGSENARLYSSVNLNNMEWNPINLNKVNFDGNDFVISNFKITKGREYNGFFGVVDYSTVSNLGLENFTVDYEYSGTTYAGGLIGHASGSTITDCYATGDVSASSSYSAYAGGLIGYAEYTATIIECYTTGDIFNSGRYTYRGRIVGDGRPKIFRCYELMEPIKITYKEDLLKLSHYTRIQDVFELTANIDLEGTEWNPINLYNSTFDGNGFVISNFKITKGREYNGFFGEVDYSTISNLGLENFTIDYEYSGTTYAGGLIGDSDDSTITDCYATGDVSTSSSGSSVSAYAGGLIGETFHSTITSCYATGDISASSSGSSADAGGLIGYTRYSTTITDCYATGDVSVSSSGSSASAYAGGLIGYADDSTIVNCYATGDVSVSSSDDNSAYAGGLVGKDYDSTITNCYAAGDVSATSAEGSVYAGGLIGYTSSWIITNCYRYEGQIITAIKGESTGTVCIEGTSASMETIWAFMKEKWDADVWEFYDDKNPTLKTNISSKIQITSKEQLINLAGKVLTLDYELTTNIDLEGIEWNPIKLYNSTFDGKGFVISNFKITTGREYNGFFGYAENSTISNLGLENFTVDYKCYDTTYAGGLVGYASSSIIIYCYATGDISASSSYSSAAYAGGLVGKVSSSRIIYCYATGDVSASSSGNSASASVGGLVGYAYHSTIIYCYATGDVSASSSYSSAYVGGLVGYAYNSTITNCYATGDVSASSSGSSASAYAGGLIGYADDSTITNCYATGDVSVSSSDDNAYASGLIGETSGSTTIINCYAIGDVSAAGTTTYWGRIVARGNPTITNCYELMEPIKITYKEDLLKLSHYTRIQDVFELTANIDLEGTEWNLINLYNSTFDGNGFVISNFKITTGREYNGFFGYVENSTISNLGLENFTIDYEYSDTTYAGGLIGRASGSTITDCYATGDVSTSSSGAEAYAGGLVGYASSAIIYCYATGDVFASSSDDRAYAGGLIGEARYSTITDCYATGDVSASSSGSFAYAGGLIGYTYDSITITNCYATGDVSASSSGGSAGGLIGYTYDSTIIKCYATGDVSISSSGRSASAGGLIGLARDSTITSCYRYEGQIITAINNESTGTIDTEGTSASMETIWAFVKKYWDADVWEFYDDKNPTLKKPQT